MQVVVSDDKMTVVVINGRLEEQYTMEEFISTFGLEALPASERLITEQRLEAIRKETEETEKKYLNAYLEFLDAVGSYAHLSKLEKNVQDGVYPVRQVAYNYGHMGHFEQELAERDAARWNRLRFLNATSQRAGYLPMDEAGMERVMSFYEDQDRRRYTRDNVRRMMKTGECLSIGDLMRKRYQVEKKNQERKSKKSAQ